MLQYVLDQVSTALIAGAALIGLIEIIVAIVAIIISGGLAFPLVVLLAAALLGLGAVGIEGTFTPQVMAELKCILYCCAKDDGTYGQAEYDCIVAEVGSKTGTVWVIIGYFIELVGPVGLTNAQAATPAGSSDCSDCGDCLCEVFVELNSGGGGGGSFEFEDDILTMTLGFNSGQGQYRCDVFLKDADDTNSFCEKWLTVDSSSELSVSNPPIWVIYGAGNSISRYEGNTPPTEPILGDAISLRSSVPGTVVFSLSGSP